jgi:Zn-dependent protease
MSKSASGGANESASKLKPVFDPRKWDAQLAMFLLGLSSALLGTFVALWYVQPGAISYAASAAGIGRAAFHAVLLIVVGFGVHEAAHYITGLALGVPVRFGTFKQNLVMGLVSLLWAFFVVGLTQTFDIPSWLSSLPMLDRESARLVLVSFIAVSPGGVILARRDLDRNINGVIAIVGPVSNLVLVGVASVLLFGTVIPPELPAFNPNMGAGFLHEVYIGVSLAFYANLYLAFFNALPIAPLDGKKAWTSGNWAIRAAQVVCIVVPVWLVFFN